MKKPKISDKTYKQGMAIFIALVMGLSIVGFIGVGGIQSSGQATNTQTIEYNGFTFENYNGLWKLNIQGTEFYFSAPPTALETIQIPTEAKNLLNHQKIYVSKEHIKTTQETTNEEETILSENTITEEVDISGLVFFYRSLFYTKGIQSFEACLTEENCGDLPIISCEDTAAIVAIQSETTQITAKDNCIYLEAQNDITRVRLAERLAYELLGVINNE